MIPVSFLGIALATNPTKVLNVKNADGALCVLLGVIVLAAVAAVLVFEIRHIIRSGENMMGRLRNSIAYISGTAVCLIHCFVCRLI